MVSFSSELELQRIKDEFLSKLEGVDLEVLLEKLCKANLITERTRSDFRNLDQRVDQNLKVKYLFQLLCNETCSDDLMSGWPKLRVICYQIMDICKNDASGINPEQKVPLTVDDIPALMEKLAGMANKWELLGIALHVPTPKLSDIRKLECSNLKLHGVLTAWIVEGTPLREVTLQMLKEKLRGRVVNEINKSESLLFGDSLPACKRPCLDYSQYSNQPNTVTVSYGMSTLLESHKPGSCKWYKDDGQSLSDDTSYEPLSDGTSYQSTSSSILLVSHRNMASRHIEGRYMCEVEGIRRSRAISVSIEYPAPSRHILDINSSLPEVPKDPWPQVVTESYVELALIEKNSKSYLSCDDSMRGNIDDFINTEVCTSYEECFGKYEGGTLLVVEGHPGVGKTTLAHKIARDWSKGENVLVGADHVFYISPIDLNVNNEISLYDLLKKNYANLEKAWIEKLKEYRSCVLLDGLNEYQGFSSGEKNIIELIRNELFKPMVIVFSRPVGNRKLIKYKVDVNRRIEILGFQINQIKDYINLFFKRNKDKAKELIKYLEEHINMFNMCYLPVHVHRICYICRQNANFFKKNTQTLIYKDLIDLIITRKQHREFCTNQLISLDKKGLGICKLAFDMCLNQKLVFENSRNEIILSDVSDSDEFSLGLVTVNLVARTLNYHSIYAFLHPKIQEYLAAYHVFSETSDQQLSLIDQHKNNDGMLVVWKFYCGLMGQKNETFDDQVQTIFSSKHADTLYRVHCAFESQQPAVCDAVIGHEEKQSSLSFKDKNLTSGDYNAISYVMSEASVPTSKLALYSCTLHENGVKQLTEYNRLQQVNTFVFHSSNSNPDQIQLVNCIFSRMESLEVLEISDANISSEHAAALADGLKSCTSLQTLKISCHGNGPESAAALANSLKSCNGLQAVEIIVNCISQ